jgi:hypothetical protein
MARTVGSGNKEIKLPEVFEMTPDERIEVLAILLTDIICEELCNQD